MNETVQEDQKEDSRRLRGGRYQRGRKRSTEESGTYTGSNNSASIQYNDTNAPDIYSGVAKANESDSGIF